MRSPSTNPKSRFVSPPHEYTARHQQGNFLGNGGASGAMVAVCFVFIQSAGDEKERLDQNALCGATEELVYFENSWQSERIWIAAEATTRAHGC